MIISPYLFFGGNCKEAVAHYERAFETKAYIGYSEAKPHLVEHAQITVGGITIMFCDCDWEGTYNKGHDFMTSIGFNEPDKSMIQTAFNILAEGGEIVIPLKESEWNKFSGTIRDKYGFRWNFHQI